MNLKENFYNYLENMPKDNFLDIIFSLMLIFSLAKGVKIIQEKLSSNFFMIFIIIIAAILFIVGFHGFKFIRFLFQNKNK